MSRLRVFELRQYTLRPGRRDALVALFDTTFVAPQDAVGAHVVGQFRDLDDPDRFVWLRGFESMASRVEALTTFYDGPVWRAHREAANATMRDSDNVLLLRPFGDDAFADAARTGTGVYAALIHDVRGVDPVRFAEHAASSTLPEATRVATLVTESATNTFPRLPVRADESVVVSLLRFDDRDAMDRGLRRTASWRDEAPDALLPAFMRAAEVIRLAPTDASALR